MQGRRNPCRAEGEVGAGGTKRKQPWSPGNIDNFNRLETAKGCYR